jgi:curved DNA-binding protein CbpA
MKQVDAMKLVKTTKKKGRKMNPYEVLGVAPDSTHEQIRAAFYELCKTKHPDMGGEHDEFVAINEAYEILGDPQKRRIFDELGVSKGSPEYEVMMDAVNHIGTLFFQLLQNITVEALLGNNIVADMQSIIMDAAEQGKKKIQAIEQSQKMLKTIKKELEKRLKKRGKSPNIFLRVVDDQISQLQSALEPEKHGVKVMEKACELLGEYDFDFDKPNQQQFANQMLQYQTQQTPSGFNPFWQG